MDYFLDILWEKIVAGAIVAGDGFDTLLMPFHFLGPGALIFLLAVLTVFITKGLNRLIVTKRYIRLEKEFNRLRELREATKEFEDREKGKRMARNIDKGELNKVYYDYFFESLLLGIARKMIPIFIIIAYLNEYFNADRLIERFGHSYAFKFNSSSGDPILIGTIPWYILSLLLGYLVWALIRRGIGRFKKKDSLTDTPTSKKA